MLSSKQRSALRSMASVIEPITQLGKGGVNEAFLDGVDKALEKRELVKITVLENSGETPREVGEEIASKLGAEFVCATGQKMVFYRKSSNPKVKHLEF